MYLAFSNLLIVYTKGSCMKTYSEWLEELIQELNYDTLIEEPWSMSFLDKDNVFQTMGNSRKNMIYVHSLDRTIAEFPVVREQLKSAKKILYVFRICRNRQVKYPLPKEFKSVFRVDLIHENSKEIAVLIDRDDVIHKKMSSKEACTFMNHYKLPVSFFEHESMLEHTQYVFVYGTLLPINSK